MSLFSSLQTDSNIENETDNLGGNGVLDTGIYAAKVSLAYAIKSQGGALGVVLHLMTDAKREIRETLWVTSGDSKGNKNYYETQDGERRYLPGFNTFQSLCLLTVGKEASGVGTEDKVINVYSPEAKKEVPTKMPVLTELHDKEIYVGLFKQTVDKRTKGADGQYHPTGETRETNEISKLFRASDKLTTAEIRGQVKEAQFYKDWLTKWEGVTLDKTSKDKNSGTAGAPPAAQTQKPTTSLFSAAS